MGYGTGAIMAVPGHDVRDFEFATTFGLPIKRVVAGRSRSAEADAPLTAADGRARRLGQLDAMPSSASTACPPPRPRPPSPPGWPSSGLGRKTINYKLRDWLFSRQRYWGEPFPIVLDEADRAHAVPESELPVLLPDLADFRPSGKPEPPLGKATEWIRYSDKLRPRDQHDAPVGRLVLVLPPLPRPPEQRPLLRPRAGELLDAGRPLRRRRRACRPAPALQPVLAQGALRPRARQHSRALPAAGQPGDDPGRDRIHGLSRRRRALGLRQPVAEGEHGHPSRGATPHGRSTPSLDAGAGREEGRRVRPGRRRVGPDRRPGAQDVEGRGNVINPDTVVRSTGPTACGFTRCSWDRSKRSSPGA